MPCISTLVIYLVNRFRYDGFVVEHHIYMMQSLQEKELKRFEDVVEKPKWVHAMIDDVEVLEKQVTTY